MAKCEYCGREMMTSSGCEFNEVKIDGKKYKRMAYGDDGEDTSGNCHDCNCTSGHYHHFGCDMEQSPDGQGQMLGIRIDQLLSPKKVITFVDEPEQTNPKEVIQMSKDTNNIVPDWLKVAVSEPKKEVVAEVKPVVEPVKIEKKAELPETILKTDVVYTSEEAEKEFERLMKDDEFSKNYDMEDAFSEWLEDYDIVIEDEPDRKPGDLGLDETQGLDYKTEAGKGKSMKELKEVEMNMGKSDFKGNVPVSEWKQFEDTVHLMSASELEKAIEIINNEKRLSDTAIAEGFEEKRAKVKPVDDKKASKYDHELDMGEVAHDIADVAEEFIRKEISRAGAKNKNDVEELYYEILELMAPDAMGKGAGKKASTVKKAYRPTVILRLSDFKPEFEEGMRQWINGILEKGDPEKGDLAPGMDEDYQFEVELVEGSIEI